MVRVPRVLPWLVVLVVYGTCLPIADAQDGVVTEPPLLNVIAGASGITDTHQDPCWGLEYRPAFRFHHLGPCLLLSGGEDDSVFIAGGAMINLPLGHDWILTPNFMAGYYESNEHLDLGFEIEFRSGIELARRFRNDHRLGLGFAHLSNSSLGEINPGTEILYMLYGIPLNALFRAR